MNEHPLLEMIKRREIEIEESCYETGETEDIDSIEYERRVILKKIQNGIECHKTLEKIIETHVDDPDKLEEILYQTDKYNCTALHYACRHYMKRIAHLILHHTRKESNMYIVSSLGITPLITCCRQGKNKMQSVFDKILEKTVDEDNLYLGKNHALQYCIINGDSKKAISILRKTTKQENLYKPSLQFTSLNMALDKGLIPVCETIVKKTTVKQNLYLPNTGKKLEQDDSSMKYKNILFYLENPLYKSVRDVLDAKCSVMRSYNEMVVKKIFVENVQMIRSLDIIWYISSFC